MSAVNDGGPAFARSPGGEGMTLRDWFAGQALAGLCQYGDDSNRWSAHFNPSDAAYRIADAMIAARTRP